ncbi:winged helix-turn-helix transcriptional regulator [Candidatus Thorarchaeota archaeon]|nr:MAG: winged helix-turn-helix transcriptional regulator [Candidatus Thorarchaeota archaeon]
MDEIDKALWQELYSNCRLSYQYLADKLDLTANAVRKRIDRLIERGVIVEWSISLSPAMIDSQYAFIEILTDETLNHDELFKQFYDRPEIYVILPLTTGDFVLHAFYKGSEGLLELGSFLRQLKGVIEARIHPTTTFNGIKTEINSLQIRVLQSLVKDPRMSISQIALETGLTARRVRKIVDHLIESKSFIFDFTWNPNAGESMAFIAKIGYDPRHGTSEEIEKRIRENYNLEYFYSHISAIEPVMFSVFMIHHIFDMEKIVNQVRKYPGVKILKPLIYYSATVIEPPTITHLEELLSES